MDLDLILKDSSKDEDVQTRLYIQQFENLNHLGTNAISKV